MKIARRWSVTDADILAAIDMSRNVVEHRPTDPLTPTTRRKLERGDYS